MRVSCAGGSLSGMTRDPSTGARDAGLARLKRATRLVVFGATALAGAFAGLAAHSAPGHKAGSAVTRTTTRTVRTTTTQDAPVTTTTATTTAAPPPVTTTVAPVATTGGT
jgi:hypothetical protein